MNTFFQILFALIILVGVIGAFAGHVGGGICFVIIGWIGFYACCAIAGYENKYKSK